MMYYFPHAIFLKLQLRIKAQITKKEKNCHQFKKETK